jgi:hypothetical protein
LGTARCIQKVQVQTSHMESVYSLNGLYVVLLPSSLIQERNCYVNWNIAVSEIKMLLKVFRPKHKEVKNLYVSPIKLECLYKETETGEYIVRLGG